MKYFELHFQVTPCNEAATDILAALLADVGCETFVPDEDGLKAYIQQSGYDALAIQGVLDEFPMPGTILSYSCQEAPDEDWNATWEAEGFAPIVMGQDLVIHDDLHADYPQARIDISIHPRQAFGTGTHQTTRMMLNFLMDSAPLTGKTVIDAGCGTGILGIASMKLGASGVVAYDIDEWSVRNAQENFERNAIDTSAVKILQGDASVLGWAPKSDLILANINRNILLADMPAFVECMKRDSSLVLSGFLAEDVPLLTEKACSLGLTLQSEKDDDEWRALCFSFGEK